MTERQKFEALHEQAAELGFTVNAYKNEEMRIQ